MNRYFYYLLFFVLFLPVILYTQNVGTVSGKLVDQNGNGLSGLQLQLYISPQVYNTTSGSDGTFTFNNVTDVKKEQLPIGYAVSENYPNPFNPKTRIGITLPNSGRVRVDVYNLLGQRVSDEIEKYFNAGNSYIDLELNGLPNGFYLARITLDGKYSVTKKLILMYGSQHLSSSAGVSYSQLNKLALDGNSKLATNLDSLVATSLIIGRKTFKNLQSMTGNSLNLGNLNIDRFCAGRPTVSYEGKTYNTVQIGTQCWLKENLDIGIMIQVNQNASNNGIIEKYCYNDDASNCATYGGLYQWNEAMAYSTTPGTKGICPTGWRIPTLLEEFQTLNTTVSGSSNALKAIGQGTGTNTSGFSALLTGCRDVNSTFYDLGHHSYFWSSTDYDAILTHGLHLDDGGSINFFGLHKEYGFSVRCINIEYPRPDVPTLLSPTNNAVDISVTPTLTWNTSSAATSYTLQVSTSNTFSSYAYNESGLTNLSQAVNGLSNWTTYYWRVSATNSYGNSGWSSIWSFTTIGTPPSAPTLAIPTNNSVDISVSPTLSWNSNIRTISYTLQVSTNSTFSNFVYNQSGLTSTSQLVTGLSNTTQYYWRVNATNNYGTSSWSSIWSFNTLITFPQPPTLSSPIDGTKEVSLSPTLYWNVSNLANSYTLQVSTKSDFSTLVYNQNDLINTNQQISGLSNFTLYYWRVCGTNDYGTSGWSSYWYFQTISGPCQGIPIVNYAGKTYNTVQIQTQCWLKENLDVGTMIQSNQNPSNNGTVEKYCYDNDQNNCTTYGGLYKWDEAMQYVSIGGVQGICPTGWHIPTYLEFQTLKSSVIDPDKLIEVGQGHATNSSGFSALLGGASGSNSFFDLNHIAYFWSSTQYDATNSDHLTLDLSYNQIYIGLSNKLRGESIRCLKD